MTDHSVPANKPAHVIAAVALAVLIVLIALALLAPGLALLAVPFFGGALVWRRHPLVGSLVIAVASGLVVALVALQLSNGLPDIWQDLVFDIAGGMLALVAVVDATRCLLRVLTGKTAAGRPARSLTS